MTAAPDDAQEGGELTVLTEGDIDYMDPGAAYYQVTYTVDFGVFRQLVAWPPDAAVDPVPDLAAEEPEVSDDGQTITYTLQEGIKYAPPLDDRDDHVRPTSSTRSSGRCCPAWPTATPRSTSPTSRASTEARPRSRRTTRSPRTSAGSRRPTTRRSSST